MYILAIETTGAFASVALLKKEKTKTEILSQIRGNDRFSHLQNLTPQIEWVLKNGAKANSQSLIDDTETLSNADTEDETLSHADIDAIAVPKDETLTIADIDAIAVSQGPGSFTGIRIGVSTARALAQVADKPCIAVPTLEALAMRAAQTAKTDSKQTLYCPILDARRSQVYGGGYFIRGGFPVEIIKAGAYTIEEFLELVKEQEALSKIDASYFLGDGVDAYREKIRDLRKEQEAEGSSRGSGTEFATEEIRYQDAVQVAILADKLYNEGGACDFEALKPEYMRLAEAERKLRDKKASK